MMLRQEHNSVPPNLEFEVDDLEQPWMFSRKFDYIHCQLMIGALQDWPKFFNQSFEYDFPALCLDQATHLQPS